MFAAWTIRFNIQNKQRLFLYLRKLTAWVIETMRLLCGKNYIVKYVIKLISVFKSLNLHIIMRYWIKQKEIEKTA
jgi:hypothetical protein